MGAASTRGTRGRATVSSRPSRGTFGAELVRRGLHAANRLVSPIESRLGPDREPLPHPPIFVVGPPRSGTTLLYQLVVESFDVGYLSNLHGWFWGAPSWIETLARPSRRRRNGDFRSDHGNTFGAFAPSECAVYWHRFLPSKPDVLDARTIGPEPRARLRAALARFLRSCDRPVVFKTVQNAGRLDVLTETLPEALFLVVRREPIDNERSLLAARARFHGTDDSWWSFEAPGFEDLSSRPPAEQVREQVLRTRLLIDESLRAFPADRVCEIDYEELCDDTDAVVATILRSLEPHGVRRRADARLPQSFPRRSRAQPA